MPIVTLIAGLALDMHGAVSGYLDIISSLLFWLPLVT